MSDECPECGDAYSSFVTPKYKSHPFDARNVEEIRVCFGNGGLFVHKLERKLSIRFMLHEKWNTIEVHEGLEVRTNE